MKYSRYCKGEISFVIHLGISSDFIKDFSVLIEISLIFGWLKERLFKKIWNDKIREKIVSKKFIYLEKNFWKCYENRLKEVNQYNSYKTFD